MRRRRPPLQRRALSARCRVSYRCAFVERHNPLAFSEWPGRSPGGSAECGSKRRDMCSGGVPSPSAVWRNLAQQGCVSHDEGVEQLRISRAAL